MRSTSPNTARRETVVVVVAVAAAAGSASGWWVAGSMPRSLSLFLMYEFQKFLTSLSVRPGSCPAMRDHLRGVREESRFVVALGDHRSARPGALLLY